MHRTHVLLSQLVLALALTAGGIFGSYATAQPAAAAPRAASLTTTVSHGGNIRQTPSLRGAVRGQAHAGEVVTLVEKTANGSWYHIKAEEAEGWISATLLVMPASLARQVPVQGATPVVQDGAITVTVYNGGNVRDNHGPYGKVIDQINAHETVQVLARCNQDVWIKIVNVRGTTGWVHKSLLNIDQQTIYLLPIE